MRNRKAFACAAGALMAAVAGAAGTEFEVYGWYGLDGKHVTLESYREARACGFTSLMQCAGVERMEKYLDWAQQAGLRLRVQHSQVLK